MEIPIYICAYLGLRRGELCGLRWQDIDFEQRTISIDATRTQAGNHEVIKDTKNTSSTRTLYLPDTLHAMLLKEKEHQETCKIKYANAYDDNPYVVVMETGKPFRPNYLSELFKKFCEEIGLPKIVLHELRHTFASLSNHAGIPSFNIGKAMGHSTPATTQKIYTHLLDQTHVQAVQGVAAIADQARLQASAYYLENLHEAMSRCIIAWDPMRCGEYEVEIETIKQNLQPGTSVESLADIIYETFCASFGMRSFHNTHDECLRLAGNVFENASLT